MPETGAVDSTQEAEVLLPQDALEPPWTRGHLERLARAYWQYLRRISLGLLRIVYAPEGPTVVLGARPLAVLRFGTPRYRTGASGGSVEWRIERGMLVAKEGRGSGFLRISVERAPAATPRGHARLAVSVAVRNFSPWLRGSGRFARFGTRLYSATQLRIHAVVTRGFLRSLARLELP